MSRADIVRAYLKAIEQRKDVLGFYTDDIVQEEFPNALTPAGATRELADLKELFGGAPLHAYTRNTITSVTKLARNCERVRTDGFALDDGEYLAEVTCVAAPLRDPGGDIVASVGISSPVTRMHEKRMARAASEVVAVARAISASLAS